MMGCGLEEGLRKVGKGGGMEGDGGAVVEGVVGGGRGVNDRIISFQRS